MRFLCPKISCFNSHIIYNFYNTNFLIQLIASEGHWCYFRNHSKEVNREAEVYAAREVALQFVFFAKNVVLYISFFKKKLKERINKTEDKKKAKKAKKVEYFVRSWVVVRTCM